MMWHKHGLVHQSAQVWGMPLSSRNSWQFGHCHAGEERKKRSRQWPLPAEPPVVGPICTPAGETESLLGYTGMINAPFHFLSCVYQTQAPTENLNELWWSPSVACIQESVGNLTAIFRWKRCVRPSIQPSITITTKTTIHLSRSNLNFVSLFSLSALQFWL